MHSKVSEYFPAGQAEHEPEPAAEYWPLEHENQQSDPPPPAFPAGHGVHESKKSWFRMPLASPAGVNSPVLQVEQALEPVVAA